MSAVAQSIQTGSAQAEDTQALTDGFHLVIDALKLNGVETIYGVPGIPITDFGRMAQAEGLRVISFRHEQHAGNAAAIAGYLTKKPGICLTVSAPGFLNGLTALANATTNCFPMILISGSSEREIVDLQQGDYEEMDQLAIAKPLCKAAFRVLHAADIGIAVARAIRAAVSGRPGGVYLDLPAKLFSQTMDAAKGEASLVKVIDPAPAQIPAPAAIQRALEVLKGAKRPLIILGKGAAYAQADDAIRAFVEKSGIPFLPMCMAKGILPDTHPQCAGAARSLVLKDADVVMLIGARLNWLLSHGKGKTWGDAPKKFIQIDIEPKEMDSNIEIAAPVVGDIGSCVSALLDGMGAKWTSAPADWTGAVKAKRDDNIAKMAPRLMKNSAPMDFHGALGALRTVIKERPDAILVNEGANTLDLARGIIDMYQPRKRLDVGTWGVMGIGMGFAIAAAVETGKPVLAIEGDSRLRLLRHGGGDDLPVQSAGLRRRLQQQRHLSRHRRQQRRRGSGDDRLRQGLPLRQDDGGLRRRRRPRDDARRAEARRRRGHGFRQADADQRGDRSGGGHRERPHRQPQSAKRHRQEEVIGALESPPQQQENGMKALEGVRILDFTHVQSGPTCTQLLAWFGADVIKVERPGVGDITRGQLRDVPDVDSLYFTMLNHNKRSITLDTKNPKGKEVLERLVRVCDVLVENFAPGVARPDGLRLGEDPRDQSPHDRRLDQGLWPGAVRGLQGLRERRAVRRRLRLHHRLPRRRAARHRRADRRFRNRPASGARHRRRALSAQHDRRGPARHLRHAGRRPQPLPRKAPRPAAPRARAAEGILASSARASSSARRCRAPATIPAAASRAAS